MPENPLHSKVDLPSFSILVEGTEIRNFYEVKSILIEKALNRVSTARIVLFDGDTSEETFPISESADFKPGKTISIKLGYHSEEEDVFEGIITAQRIKVMSYSHKITSQLIITCHDKAIRMSLGRKTTNFSDKKDSDVISTLIQDAGLTAAVTATTFEHASLIQYNCSDWDFMLSRADANGMVVTNEAGKVTVGAPEVSGTEVLELNYGTNVMNFSGELDGLSQIKSAAYQSWNSTTHALIKGTGVEPSVNTQGDITGKSLAKDVGADPELAATNSAPEDTSLLKAWGDSLLQRSRLSRLRGTITFSGSNLAAPGKLIKLVGFGSRFNGTAFVSGVKHEVHEGTWTTEAEFGLSHKMVTDTGQIEGAGAMGLLPPISGLHIGKVKKIDADPKGEYRVQVDVPMIEDSGTGIWVRLTNPYASADVGFYFFPEVGDEVILGFLNNDPRFGIILGSLYGKKNKPGYTPESTNKDKAIVTKSNLKITFNDTDKTMVFETPGGHKVTLDDKTTSVKLEDSNKNSIKMESSGITITSDSDIKLVAKGKISLTPTGNAEVTSKGDVKLTGNNVNAKANMALSLQGTASAEFKASGTVTVKGALVQIN
jgi:Rhs element Vgr protein